MPAHQEGQKIRTSLFFIQIFSKGDSRAETASFLNNLANLLSFFLFGSNDFFAILPSYSHTQTKKTKNRITTRHPTRIESHHPLYPKLTATKSKARGGFSRHKTNFDKALGATNSKFLSYLSPLFPAIANSVQLLQKRRFSPKKTKKICQI